MRHKKVFQHRLITLLVAAVGIILFIVLCYCIYNIFVWGNDNQRSSQIVNNLRTEKKNNVVNFNNLKKQNSDTVAWLTVSNTNIDYPVVKAADNDYYLNHDFMKDPSQTGWVFADYLNDFNQLDQNTIIYGHASVSGLMFGTLKNVFNIKPNSDSSEITLITENKETKWQIFSIYHIKTTDDYLVRSFASREKIDRFIKLIANRSEIDFYDIPNNQDKILTLSTCHNEYEKTVIHAKLKNLIEYK